MTAAATVDAGVLRWYEQERDALGAEVFDAHTHVGVNDPDTMRCTPDQLLGMVEEAGARAVVFPLHEPDGYPGPNDEVLALAAASGDRLVAFARLNPHDEPFAEAQRTLAAGAAGFKLHPRAEQFPLDTPSLEDVFALADAERLPVLVHAGRGIPALGAQAVAACERYPGMRLILAHAGISDLAWIGSAARDLPNLYFDTSWWLPADLLALLTTVPPGQILYASDAPYGRIPAGALMLIRLARQAGLDDEVLRLVLGGQLRRLLAREDPVDAGPASGSPRLSVDLLLDRVSNYVGGAVAQLLRQVPGDEMLSLARLACEVPPGSPQEPHARTILALLDARDRLVERLADASEPASILPGIYYYTLAVTVARTPDVPIPDGLVFS